MPIDCELCEKPANNQVDGHSLCVDHIVEHNRNRIQSANSAGVNKTAPATPKATNARLLATRLNGVLDDLLNGKIEAEQAFAACKVSNELIKLFELTWRMEG